MKKAISLVLMLVILLAAVGCKAQKTEKEAITENRDGKVSVYFPVKSTTYNKKGDIYATETWEYNTAQRCLTKVIYSSSGDQEMDRREFYFNEDGKIEKEVMFSLGEKYREEVYQYDKNGNLTERCIYMQGELTSRTYREYDESSCLVRGSSYEMAFGEYSFEIIYNENGHMVEEITYTEDDWNEISGRTKYRYDEQGNMIEEIDCTNETEVLLKKFEYDEKHNLIKEIAYSDGTAVGEKIWVYDEKGNLTDYTGKTEGSIMEREVYQYDLNGTLQEKVVYTLDAGVETGREVDRYDAQGNNIEHIVYKNGQEYSRVAYHYDSDGNCLTKFHDGNKKPSEENRYDAFGNRIEWIDYDEDGAVEMRTVREYKEYWIAPELKETLVGLYLLPEQ